MAFHFLIGRYCIYDLVKPGNRAMLRSAQDSPRASRYNPSRKNLGDSHIRFEAKKINHLAEHVYETRFSANSDASG
jgi:hypothetical protein